MLLQYNGSFAVSSTKYLRHWYAAVLHFYSHSGHSYLYFFRAFMLRFVMVRVSRIKGV
jgi:hypothetical protein